MEKPFFVLYSQNSSGKPPLLNLEAIKYSSSEYSSRNSDIASFIPLHIASANCLSSLLKSVVRNGDINMGKIKNYDSPIKIKGAQ